MNQYMLRFLDFWAREENKQRQMLDLDASINIEAGSQIAIEFSDEEEIIRFFIVIEFLIDLMFLICLESFFRDRFGDG